ncbi:MAG: LpxI family protein [Hyphomicrobiaceae bacterium]
MTPLGILAAGGGIPIEIAETAAANGRPVHLVGLVDEADPAIARFPHTWIAWGQIGRMLAALRAAGCRDVVIVGRTRRPALRSIKPDFGLLAALPTLVRSLTGGDDRVLRQVIRFFEDRGFRICGVPEVAPTLLAGAGVLARHRPSAQHESEAARGLALIAALAPWDIGQAVAVCDGQVLAIEAAEGTDGMLRRLADRSGTGGVFVKAPKPGQELRIDLPAIGPDTVVGARRAGLAGLALAAGRVVVAARRDVLVAADAAGLFLVGLNVPASAQPVPTGEAGAAAIDRTALGRIVPRSRDRIDIAKGIGVLRTVARFGTSAGVVVARAHVLGIETGEGLDRLVRRIRDLKQWGDRETRRRRGVLIVRAASDVTDGVIAGAAAADLAGLAVANAGAEVSLGALGDRHGLFVVAG